MTASQDLLRQVRQNSNDIRELYELNEETNKTVTVIAEVQLQHGDRLGAIESRLGTIEGTHGEMLGSHGEKLDEILGILKAS